MTSIEERADRELAMKQRLRAATNAYPEDVVEAAYRLEYLLTIPSDAISESGAEELDDLAGGLPGRIAAVLARRSGEGWVSDRPPSGSGTYDTVDKFGNQAFLYWNADTKRWHPLRGWQARRGVDRGTVRCWHPRPSPPGGPDG